MGQFVIRGLVMSVAIFALAGCSDESDASSGDPTGGMGGSGAGGGNGGMGGGAACNELDIDAAPVVPYVQVDMDAPMPMGGANMPVLHHLTDVTVYTGVGGATGPTGETRQEVSDCNDTVCNVAWRESSQPEVHRRTWDIAYDGSDVTFTETCGGGPASFTLGYTYTGTAFILYVGGNTVFTFTDA